MAEIIEITHENGTLSEYTATVTDAGDLSVSAAAALAGSNFGLAANVDDINPIYGYWQAGAAITTGKLRYRFYIDPNSLTMAGATEHTVVMITDISSNPVSFVLLHRTAGGEYGIYAVCVNDAGSHINTQVQTITDAPHYIEVLTQRAATSVSADGFTQFWVDGVLAFSTIPVDNFDQMADYQLLIVGAPSGLDASTSGVFYLDELVFRDDDIEIGPAAAAATPTRRRRGMMRPI